VRSQVLEVRGFRIIDRRKRKRRRFELAPIETIRAYAERPIGLMH